MGVQTVSRVFLSILKLRTITATNWNVSYVFESSGNTPSFQAFSMDLIWVAFPYREGLQWVTVQKKTVKIIATVIVVHTSNPSTEGAKGSGIQGQAGLRYETVSK